MPIAVQSVVGFRCLPLSASTALRYAAGRLRPDLSLWLLWHFAIVRGRHWCRYRAW